MTEATPRRPWLAAGSLLLLAVAVGVTLRLWNLGAQVMAGDELHAVRAALERPVSGILFVYQSPDNCIPLTLFDRLVLEAGGRLGEWIVRMPALLAGLALLVLGPWWAWRRLGPGTAAVFAALLAISPALVFYSRIARPYAPAALLGFLTVAAFDAWQRRPGSGPAAAYVAFASLALWFHLGSGPLVVAPLVVGGIAVVLRRGRGTAALLGLAGAIAVAFLALLLPARATLLALVSEKHETFALVPGEGAEVAALLAGVRFTSVAVGFWLLVAIGIARLGRRDRWLAALAVAALGGQLTGIALLAPMGLQSPVILDRYLMPALPWALVLVAEALGAPWPDRWRRLQPGVAVLAVAMLLSLGPFFDGELAHTSFAHDEPFLRFTAPRRTPTAETSPAIYRWLATAPAGPVLETPWHPVWRFSRATAGYQRLHRREVVVAVSGPVFGDPRLAFRNMVPARPSGLLGSRARWLVVHRDIGREEERVAPDMMPPVMPSDLRRRLREAAARHAAVLRATWGPPDRADRSTSCWDLERIRREMRRADPPAAQRGAPSPPGLPMVPMVPMAASTASARIVPRVSIVSSPSAAVAAAGSPK